jgi:ATP-dependent DNA helicase DinG
MIGINEAFAEPRQPEGTRDGALVGLPPLIEAVFAADGPFVAQLHLEHRPQQSEMALAVAQAMVTNQVLLFEAGTGVGKSLAYLLPGLVHAQLAERPFLVSTHTIALQEQILHQDLELCRRLFKRIPALQPFADFRVSLLVGRGNYLCGTRLAQAIETKAELFPSAELSELERIAEWSQTTAKGLAQELSPGPLPQVWEWVNADGHACNRRNCTPETCFYRRALEEVRKSHLVVVNHALLFALIGAGMQPRGKTRGVLYAGDFVVLDEAHRVPAVASDYFGNRLSSYGVDRLLARLYSSPGKGRKARGLLLRLGNETHRSLVREARAACARFFTEVETLHLAQREVVRCREEDWASADALPPLQNLHKALGDLVGRMEDGPPRDELQGARTQLASIIAGMRECLSLGDDGQVYWVERTGRRKSVVTLRSAPIDVAGPLREHLFRRQTSVVLTSATLAEGSSMESFQARIGADGCLAEQVHSPFDFERQMRVFIAADAPEPTRQQARLDHEYLAALIGFCAERVAGGSLVLFTSYHDLRECARLLAPALAKAGKPMLQQGQDGSRQELAREMARLGNAVLLGTESFWTGIDVAGPALSQVIITRLPFENPSHPIVEARAEWCRERGGQPFAEITLPDAIVKFRQGIGRLIRRQDDYGTITILDSRVLHRPYGREFLAVLPQPNFTRFTRATMDLVFQPLAQRGEGS